MRPFWPQRMEKLKELAEQGLSSHQIADYFGTTHRAVQKICSLNGISIARRPGLPGSDRNDYHLYVGSEADRVQPDPFEMARRNRNGNV